MGLFKKTSDPLNAELRRLEEEQRKLEQQVSDIEYALQNPPEPALGKEPVEPEAGNKGAKFLHDPLLGKNTVGKNRTRLKVQRTKARNRVILICIGLAILALIVYRAWS
jgi:cell division protein FtsB